MGIYFSTFKFLLLEEIILDNRLYVSRQCHFCLQLCKFLNVISSL